MAAPAVELPAGEQVGRGWQAGHHYTYAMALATTVAFAGTEARDFELTGELDLTWLRHSDDVTTLRARLGNGSVFRARPRSKRSCQSWPRRSS